MLEVESVDIDFWRDENIFTVWQAAFLMCNFEPWDEPISSNANMPERVEKMRAILLASIPNYKTGEIFSQSGRSCKTQRPAQLSVNYFKRDELKNGLKINF